MGRNHFWSKALTKVKQTTFSRDGRKLDFAYHDIGLGQIFNLIVFSSEKVQYTWGEMYIKFICTAVVDESEEWSSSKFSNLSNWKQEAWKISGLIYC